MFLPHKSDNGAVLPWETMAAAAGTYKAGQFLNVGSSGLLETLTAEQDTTPPYLCMSDKSVAEGELLPVTRVSYSIIYETELSEDVAGAAPGMTLQVDATGTMAAEGPGTFELVRLEGESEGDAVYGRWVAAE